MFGTFFPFPLNWWNFVENFQKKDELIDEFCKFNLASSKCSEIHFYEYLLKKVGKFIVGKFILTHTHRGIEDWVLGIEKTTNWILATQKGWCICFCRFLSKGSAEVTFESLSYPESGSFQKCSSWFWIEHFTYHNEHYTTFYKYLKSSWVLLSVCSLFSRRQLVKSGC